MGYYDAQGRYRRTEQAYIELPLGAFTEADATALAAFADGTSTTPGYAVDNSEAFGIRWNNHANPDPIAHGFSLPADRKPGTNVVVRIKASKTGATVGDATTFDVGMFFHPVGALRDADATAGGASSAMDGDAPSKTVQEVTRTILAANIPDSSATDPVASGTITLQPTDGTLGTDDVTIHQVLLEYTRQDLAE